MTDAELLSEAARRAQAREPFALCTVTATARSAPRDAGAKMLVAPDGAIAGTVGGGPLEAVIIAEAKRLLASGGPSMQRSFTLTTEGDVAGEVQRVSDDFGELGMKCGGEVSVFLDVVLPPPRLLVYGAGHVGERVAAIAGEAGLATAVVDDRPEFAEKARFPKALEVRCANLDESPLGGLRPDAHDFIVVLTRCHALDEKVLEAALGTAARYVGLIGSRRKVAVILRSIARRSGRDPRADERLHAPIGLRLGDKTPGEIAISVLAEVLLYKSGGALEHARLPPRENTSHTISGGSSGESSQTISATGGAEGTRPEAAEEGEPAQRGGVAGGR